MASPSPTVVVSVLGVSRLDGENYSSHQGIGKSCLCYRFMYPGYDGYQQDHRSHCSLLALHEFESDVIQKDHFLYWGSTTRTYDVKGLSEMVHFEVLEHTVFYQDVTDKPFLINSSKKSMWSFDAYLKIALDRRLDSPCKMSYKNRDLISAPQEYGSVLFPPGIGKNKRGFVVVIDVSDSGPTFERRLRLTEKMAKHLASRKEKFVVAATKRDESFAPSLEKLSELARACKFTLIEVSAKSNVNVSKAFEIVAAKVLGKTAQGLSTHVPAYHDAVLKALLNQDNARHAFRSYLQKRVTVASELLKAIELTEEYKACAHLHGKFETDKMFAQHVVTLRNDEISAYPDVTDSIGMRQQFLETYVVERTDLSPYISYLKDLIIKICQMCSNKVSIPPSPTPPHPLLERNACTTDLNSDNNSPDSCQDAGELRMSHSEATQSLDGNNSSRYAQVKNGPSSVSVKRANIDPGIVTANIIMESDGNLMFLPPAFISEKISSTPDIMIPTSSPRKNYFASSPVPTYHTLRPPAKPPQVDGLANNNHSVCQVDSTVDFIDHDEATQEADEGIYAMIMDNQTDMHSHVCDEKEEDALEEHDDGNYMYIPTNSYRVIDIAGSERHDACIAITGVEVSNEEDHKSVNTSEVSGLDLEPVAASQSLQYTAPVFQLWAESDDDYVDMTGMEMSKEVEDPDYVNTYAILHLDQGPLAATQSIEQPSSQLQQCFSQREGVKGTKPLHARGSTMLGLMAHSGVGIVDLAASPVSRQGGVEDQGNVTLQTPQRTLHLMAKPQPLYRAFMLNKNELDTLAPPSSNNGRVAKGFSDHEVMTHPMSVGTAAKKSMVNVELKTTKKPLLCATKETVVLPVTTSKTEINTMNSDTEKLTLAKIREKLGKEIKKDKNDSPFPCPSCSHTQDTIHNSMPPSPHHSPVISASECSFVNKGIDFTPHDNK